MMSYRPRDDGRDMELPLRKTRRPSRAVGLASYGRFVALGLGILLLCTWGLYYQVQYLVATQSPALHTSTLEQIKYVERSVREVVWEGREDIDADEFVMADVPAANPDVLLVQQPHTVDPIVNYQCRGWRQTGGCSPTGAREAQNDRKCHEAIKGGSSGYCEFYDPATNRTLHLLESTCTTVRGDARFSCNMAKDILMFHKHADNYRHPYLLDGPKDAMKYLNHSEYAGPISVDDDDVDASTVTRKWYDKHPTVQKVYPTNGIVMVVYEKALVSLYASVRLLRTVHNSSLPIELWYRADELSVDHPVLANLLGTFRDIRLREIRDPRATGFYVKPYTLFFSHFENVLFLDADNFPLRDPTYLFHLPEFTSTGAIFWPDFWHPRNTIFNLHDDSLVWPMLNLTYVDMMEQESGQLLLSRSRHEKALHMLMFYAFHRIAPQPQPDTFPTQPLPTTSVEESEFEDYVDPEIDPLHTIPNMIQGLKLAWGDKDLFRFAWLKTNASFHMIATPPGAVGLWGWIKYMRPDATPFQRFCGQSMLQYDTTGEKLFLHRNTIKLGVTKASRSPQWQYIQTLRPGVSIANYTVNCWVENTYSCFGRTEGTNEHFTGELADDTVVSLEKSILAFAESGAALVPATPAPTIASLDASDENDKMIPGMQHGRRYQA
ncbi:hypothetical protein SDRG_06853 [Saprolegnia diclina VS20]|uniref:Uncharacterized protein n=1 Tax=Saprolegnia diclina (strain VS20) TaxID=1156394 RepID=T0QCF8_SAPDV|nr:hypothetical protein SDRG_06853 [Saprolegnia diclina VS20]EQC35564.1 hypothetical protein SDRG_06853 [Saprolegnia diclina VS20]|eukprot:XP_008610881.1 hypothetical protein SDRG_06853 [Saprolegnia diclina VS20]